LIINALPTKAVRRSLALAAYSTYGKQLVRTEVGDMVIQLHELRRRLTQMESGASQEAIESVVKACIELDAFLRSDVPR